MEIDLKEFGSKLRSLRIRKNLGVRELATKSGMSHTFLSRVEMGKQTPPAEDKLRALARELECDPDELLAMSGRLPADVVKIIRKHPKEYIALLRGLRNKSANQLDIVLATVESSAEGTSAGIERMKALGKNLAGVTTRVKRPAKVKFVKAGTVLEGGNQ